MHSGVVTCLPEDTLRTVAAILAANRIHAVVVANPERRPPYAVVTDRDVVFGHSVGKLDRLTAREAASEPTVTVRADLGLRDAAGLMARHGTTHVVVTDPGDGAPVGVLSSLDIAAAVGAA
ncbi:MAG TPA: CBS domain-containing protein [Gaiellaceae bacterium]|jgi:CBS domain-containing protein